MFSENDKIYQIPENALLKNARGEFFKRVLVIAQAELMHPGNLDFLKKILFAAGLDLSKDALFVELQEADQVALFPVEQTKQPESVLVFGVSPAQLGLNIQIPLYQPTPFYGMTFLFSDKLSELEPDKIRKANLWQALRQMYL
ncbi:MAG: hypothetical protein IPM98_02295 [Lewinellaceae bacterium]|nr:hypothetical protein [Lewinellaceae bacterium]